MEATTPEPDRPPRVLVVDDSEVIRNLIQLNLELEGFEVRSVNDGEAALEVVADFDPAVVTLDAIMPRLGGFETVSLLRARPDCAHIPIVMVTARAQASDIEKGRGLGVDAYVTKPFEPSDLVECVARLAREGRSAGADRLDR